MPVSSYVCKSILDLPNNTGCKKLYRKIPLLSCGKIFRIKCFKSPLSKIKTLKIEKIL
jgi:hypothetical protein